MRVVIVVEGGIVQAVFADAPVEAVLVDHDTESVDEAEITVIDPETEQGAVISTLPVEPIAALSQAISAAIEEAVVANGR